MRALWEGSLRLGGRTVAPQPIRAWVRRLRSSSIYQRFFQCLKWWALPVVFGTTLLVASILLGAALVAVTGLRAGIWIAEYHNIWCPQSGGSSFITTTECLPLAESVKAAKRYRVSVTVTKEWRDDPIDTSVGGFGPSTMGFKGTLFSPLRRSLSGQWFQPMVKIVPKDGLFAMVALEMHRADVVEPRYTAQFTAPKSGRVYFFVNDVLLPKGMPYAEYFDRNNIGYKNNIGSATVAIEEVVPPKVTLSR